MCKNDIWSGFKFHINFVPFHISWSISFLVEFLGVVALFDGEELNKGENNYDKEEVFYTNMILLPLWQPLPDIIRCKNFTSNFLISWKRHFYLSRLLSPSFMLRKLTTILKKKELTATLYLQIMNLDNDL